jgi:hypothetical protein
VTLIRDVDAADHPVIVDAYGDEIPLGEFTACLVRQQGVAGGAEVSS